MYVGFLPDRDVLPGQSIFDAIEHAAAASMALIVVISTDFHSNQICRLVLSELLMSTGPLLAHRSHDRHALRQVVTPIIRGECQLPFGLISAADLLIRCHDSDTMVQPADMVRLRRLLKSKSSALSPAD